VALKRLVLLLSAFSSSGGTQAADRTRHFTYCTPATTVLDLPHASPTWHTGATKLHGPVSHSAVTGSYFGPGTACSWCSSVPPNIS